MTSGERFTTLHLNSANPWMSRAWGDLGIAEIPGAANNPRIVAAHAHTKGGAGPDELSWCASWLGLILEEAGFESTRSKMARSYQTYGLPSVSYYGAIAVLWRGERESPFGHVGFLVGWMGSHIALLGGNQSNAVTVQRYPIERVLGYRLPVRKQEVAA